MKHDIQTTLVLILLFIIAQSIGLGLLAIDAEVITTPEGTTQVSYPETSLGPRPDLSPFGAAIMLGIGVLIGTALILLLIKFKFVLVWKVWFALALIITMTLSFGVLVPLFTALILAFLLMLWRVFYPSAFVHNFTEVFVYAGLALLFVPILSIGAVLILLLLISLYDAYAVWKSKHMIKLAEFQKDANTFAGLAIPKKKSVAILGGGDIAFPLLLSGVVFKAVLAQGATKLFAVSMAGMIVLGATVALSLLFFKGKANRYYPAMPFLTLGCLVGFAIVLVMTW